MAVNYSHNDKPHHARVAKHRATKHKKVARYHHRKKHHHVKRKSRRTVVASLEDRKNEITNLQVKYADILGAEAAVNPCLKEEILEWYGTPYQYGGNSKNGIDCSAFVQTLMNDVYNVQLPRTSDEQYDYCQHIDTSNLQEGDLVFFSSERNHNDITHVGVYLQNGNFVHASSSNGVMISRLDDSYWEREFVGAGRTAPLISQNGE